MRATVTFSTRPLQLAVGMTDCPVGSAAWIYDFMFNHVDAYLWTPEEIITWTMMYYIQGPYGGFAMYHELAKVRAITSVGIFPLILT
jgi:hypothetical protein